MTDSKLWPLVCLLVGIYLGGSAIFPVSANGMSEKTLYILLGETGRAPYEETAPASILETFNAAVLGQLLWRNSSFELEPGLIKHWKWNPQENAYTLTLRDDIYFHNGRHATAEDLEFSILRGFFTKYRSFYKIYLNNIDGLEDKEALQPNYIDWKKFPIGAGPYKIIDQDLAQARFVLAKTSAGNLNAPQKVELHTKPKLEKYDIISFSEPAANGEFFNLQYPKYPKSIWNITFTTLNLLGRHPTFHKAIQHGVNRVALAEGLTSCQPAYEMLPSHFWGRASITNSFDLKRAKELFSSLPKNLQDKTWPVPVFGGKIFSPERKILLKRLREQFAAFGFKVAFYPSVEKFLSKKTAAESPIHVSGMVANYVDPVVMFSSFSRESPFEYDRADDKIFEELYTLAKTVKKQEERLKTVRNLSSYFNEKAIAIPLLEMKNVYYINPKTIKTLGEQDEPLYLYMERIVMQ